MNLIKGLVFGRVTNRKMSNTEKNNVGFPAITVEKLREDVDGKKTSRRMILSEEALESYNLQAKEDNYLGFVINEVTNKVFVFFTDSKALANSTKAKRIGKTTGAVNAKSTANYIVETLGLSHDNDNVLLLTEVSLDTEITDEVTANDYADHNITLLELVLPMENEAQHEEEVPVEEPEHNSHDFSSVFSSQDKDEAENVSEVITM